MGLSPGLIIPPCGPSPGVKWSDVAKQLFKCGQKTVMHLLIREKIYKHVKKMSESAAAINYNIVRSVAILIMEAQTGLCC